MLFASVGVRGEVVNAKPAGSIDVGPIEVTHEVRTLRKMHMVRPDLIPFPITVEVYC